MRKTSLKQLFSAVLIASTAMLFGCSGGSSSGGIYGQTFNVSGQWAGQITDGNVMRAMTASLGDGGGTVNGTMLVTNHSCYHGAALSGTATQAAQYSTGDNPLTAVQENQNDGSVNLTITIIETIGDEDFTRTTIFNMQGNSSYLVGKYNGNWVPQLDEDGAIKEIPGFEDSKSCRGHAQGDIVLYKQSQY